MLHSWEEQDQLNYSPWLSDFSFFHVSKVARYASAVVATSITCNSMRMCLLLNQHPENFLSIVFEICKLKCKKHAPTIIEAHKKLHFCWDKQNNMLVGKDQLYDQSFGWSDLKTWAHPTTISFRLWTHNWVLSLFSIHSQVILKSRCDWKKGHN